MDGAGAHGVWTCICLGACGRLGCLFALPAPHARVVGYCAREVWGLWVCLPCGVHRGAPDAPRLPALGHVWGCRILGESLSVPGAKKALSEGIVCIKAEDFTALVSFCCCSGRSGDTYPAPHLPPRIRWTQLGGRPWGGGSAPPHPLPLGGVSLQAGDGET